MPQYLNIKHYVGYTHLVYNVLNSNLCLSRLMPAARICLVRTLLCMSATDLTAPCTALVIASS